MSRESQLRLFDQATERHGRRASARKAERTRERGWQREGPLLMVLCAVTVEEIVRRWCWYLGTPH
jgi:hypothetical protein